MTLAMGILLTCQRVTVKIQNHRMSIHDQFGLEGTISDNQVRVIERTAKT